MLVLSSTAMTVATTPRETARVRGTNPTIRAPVRRVIGINCRIMGRVPSLEAAGHCRTVARLPPCPSAKCMPPPCDEAPPGWAGQMEATRRQDPTGAKEEDPPWKAPQARARDDEISTDAIRSS